MTDRPNLLPPSLRERRRYLAFQILSEDKVNFSDLSNSIWHSILNLLGEKGAGEAELWLPRNIYNEIKQIGLIRCSHLHVENIRAALALIDRIGDIRVIVKVLGVSGTMKAAQAKFFEEAKLSEFVK